MAVTKKKEIRAIEIFPDGSMKVYYTVTFTANGETDIANRTKTYQKSESKPAAILTFLNNSNAA